MENFNKSNSTNPFQNLHSPEGISTFKGIIIIFLALTYFCFSVVGNGLVILAYIIDKNVRNIQSNSYLVALAFVDFLIGLIVIPFGFIYNYNLRWNFGIEFCQIWLVASYGLSPISSGHLVLIALDRYRILFQGIPYLQRRTIWNIIERVGFTWLLGLWMVLPILFDWEHISFDPLVHTHCFTKKKSTWVLLVNVMTFFLPGLLMIRLYTGIYFELKRRLREKVNTSSVTPSPQNSTSNNNWTNNGLSIKSNNRLSVPKLRIDLDGDFSDNELDIGKVVKKRKLKICLKKERRAACTLLVLIGLFLICWAPYVVITSIQAFDSFVKIPKILNTACALMGWVNACVNPVVYIFRNKEFRIAFRRIFNCCKNR